MLSSRPPPCRGCEACGGHGQTRRVLPHETATSPVSAQRVGRASLACTLARALHERRRPGSGSGGEVLASHENAAGPGAACDSRRSRGVPTRRSQHRHRGPCTGMDGAGHAQQRARVGDLPPQRLQHRPSQPRFQDRTDRPVFHTCTATCPPHTPRSPSHAAPGLEWRRPVQHSGAVCRANAMFSFPPDGVQQASTLAVCLPFVRAVDTHQKDSNNTR